MMEITESVYRMAKFCDALSNGVRLQLLLLLQNDSENVSELASKLERDRSTISRQLGKLADHNLVQSKASGRENIYSLKRPGLIEQFLKVQPLLER